MHGLPQLTTKLPSLLAQRQVATWDAHVLELLLTCDATAGSPFDDHRQQLRTCPPEDSEADLLRRLIDLFASFRQGFLEKARRAWDEARRVIDALPDPGRKEGASERWWSTCGSEERMRCRGSMS